MVAVVATALDRKLDRETGGEVEYAAVAVMRVSAERTVAGRSFMLMLFVINIKSNESISTDEICRERDIRTSLG